MDNIIRIETISQLHEMVGYEKPDHPLISLFEPDKMDLSDLSFLQQPITTGLYSISLKNGKECQIQYGRKQYDFQEGSLIFLAPGQLIMPVGAAAEPSPEDRSSWILLFHPDLIRRSTLADKMKEYTFFHYDSHEALHLSDKERKTVTDIAFTIKQEFSMNMDNFSQELIISNLELLLNYCKRFYGRQFLTRTNFNKDIVASFEVFLKTYFESGAAETEGLPTVKFCAREMGYSPNYFSDLLKKETGKSAQEHIQFQLIEKAKNLLLGTEETVSRIAYSLGFEYPQHFSKLFKNKTGMSPVVFRGN